eukprot:CAMPEP_0196582298 /NCGR_PEP_ID=MMETSP1081-20130531/38544_1 /TAXON_ID=36882 /ORGANISM="Pyramimonas amylifera, Strain CCMP720" /LENGTH=216 /DNA_ID=CAMNT_0041902823 /DNA_START=18 /DNA_END=668 /DNA_ORIENTATION=+
MYHDAERRKEAAEINASLYALRECVRFRRMQREAALYPDQKGPHVHVPYRSSQLTRVLMECFVKEEARMAVIATVSPNPTDTEHSITTLRTACMISGRDKDCRETKEDVPEILTQIQATRMVAPVHWTNEDVIEWLMKVRKGTFSHLVDNIPSSINGRALVRLTEVMLANICGDKQLGIQVYDAIRREIAKVDEYMSQRRQEARECATRAKSRQYG